jgi:hypothetical protein
MRAQRAFAHHAAQNGHSVLPDLHHGEIVARLLLRAQHALGAGVALLGQLAQAQTPGRRERDLGHREESTGCNQQPNEQQAGTQGHAQ